MVVHPTSIIERAGPSRERRQRVMERSRELLQLLSSLAARAAQPLLAHHHPNAVAADADDDNGDNDGDEDGKDRHVEDSVKSEKQKADRKKKDDVSDDSGLNSDSNNRPSGDNASSTGACFGASVGAGDCNNGSVNHYRFRERLNEFGGASVVVAGPSPSSDGEIERLHDRLQHIHELQWRDPWGTDHAPPPPQPLMPRQHHQEPRHEHRQHHHEQHKHHEQRQHHHEQHKHHHEHHREQHKHHEQRRHHELQNQDPLQLELHVIKEDHKQRSHGREEKKRDKGQACECVETDVSKLRAQLSHNEQASSERVFRPPPHQRHSPHPSPIQERRANDCVKETKHKDDDVAGGRKKADDESKRKVEEASSLLDKWGQHKREIQSQHRQQEEREMEERKMLEAQNHRRQHYDQHGQRDHLVQHIDRTEKLHHGEKTELGQEKDDNDDQTGSDEGRSHSSNCPLRSQPNEEDQEEPRLPSSESASLETASSPSRVESSSLAEALLDAPANLSRSPLIHRHGFMTNTSSSALAQHSGGFAGGSSLSGGLEGGYGQRISSSSILLPPIPPPPHPAALHPGAEVGLADLYRCNNPGMPLAPKLVPVVPPQFRYGCNEPWAWSNAGKSHEVRVCGVQGQTAFFHPNWSNGTAGVRGNRPINDGAHYWEIRIPSRLFGTSMMFGVSTRQARMHADTFCNLLGEDQHSWGLSHKGLIWHKGAGSVFCAPFAENSAVTVGVVYNGDQGTLEYYKNGNSLGVAFTGLDQVSEDLYPSVSSTAAKTEMTLGLRRRAFRSLQDRCRSSIVRRMHQNRTLPKAPLLPLPTVLVNYVMEEASALTSPTSSSSSSSSASFNLPSSSSSSFSSSLPSSAVSSPASAGSPSSFLPLSLSFSAFSSSSSSFPSLSSSP